jgi:hypothetical protein
MAYLLLWAKWLVVHYPIPTLLVLLGLGWAVRRSSQGGKP